MKKKFFLPLLLICYSFYLTGCFNAIISAEMLIYGDESGTKTIVAEIYGDKENVPKTVGDAVGTGVYPTGNNSAFLIIGNNELKNKIIEYCPLKGIDVQVSNMDMKSSGIMKVVVSFDFVNINDYNEKMNIMAGNEKDNIENALLIKNSDNTFTYKEKAKNTFFAIKQTLEDLYNDKTVFNKNALPDYPVTDNKLFCKDDMLDGAYVYAFSREVVTIGNSSSELVYIDFDNGNVFDKKEYLEVTGTPEDKPSKKNNLFWILAILGILCIAGGVTITIFVGRKKK